MKAVTIRRVSNAYIVCEMGGQGIEDIVVLDEETTGDREVVEASLFEAVEKFLR